MALSPLLIFISVGTATAGEASLSIVPKPKEIEYLHASPVPLDAGSVAIVIGDKAVEPEEYAAETLRKNVSRRFGQTWPVCRESDDLKAYKVLILLGQRGTNEMLNGLCRQWKVDLSSESLGHDGYVIQMRDYRDQYLVLIGGSNARGAIYGQDTLFQLLSTRDGETVLVQAAVRDWPSIPWRGRPQSRTELHLEPGTMDAYARARVNFIDLRDGPAPRRGQYAYPPGFEIDVQEVKTVLNEAHRRGIIVYATVNCAVPVKDFDAAINTFGEFVALGVDGLWISIDDPGAEYRHGTPLELIRRVLELGRKHGITGHKIAIVPGKGSYGNILTDVNRAVAAIPGMEDALWFFTPIPSAQNLENARAIGLKSKPGWWHNWPRPEGGLTHGAYGGVNFRQGDKRSYLEIPPLAMGWGEAGYETLAEAGKHTDAIMPWGGGGWGADYTADVLGWWAWAPELHDWDAVRGRIHQIVFGPDQVDAASEFDSQFVKLKDFFVRPGSKPTPDSNWPPRLKNPEDCEKVKELIADMKVPLREIELGAPKRSLVNREMLRNYYLEPIRATLNAATNMARFAYPEYWWPAHEKRVLTALHAGNLQQAEEWRIDAIRRVGREVPSVREWLGGSFRGIDEYCQSWESRFEPLREVHRAMRPPRLAGDLSDPLWRQSPVLKLVGGSSGNETELRLLYTPEALYVGFLCYETDTDRLVTGHKARDSEIWTDDSVEIFVNPNALGQPYYQFISNVEGAVLDGRHLPGEPFDITWNGDWEVKTARGKDHWTAEFRIPFRSIGVEGSAKGRIWLFNFARNDRAGEFHSVMGENYEMSAWSPAGSLHDTSKFRPIQFAE